MFRPLLLISSKVSQGIFIHSVYNSTLFLSSRCCSFFLDVVANLICIFLVSSQLVLLSALKKCIYSFVVKGVYLAVLQKYFISIDVNHFFLYFCLFADKKALGRLSTWKFHNVTLSMLVSGNQGFGGK